MNSNKIDVDQKNDNPETKTVSTNEEPVDTSYHLKWIPWNTSKIPIVMQSKNGPCPLIATMNVLLLKEKIKLPNLLEQITENQLFTYLGECLMDSIPAQADSSNNDGSNSENDENLLDFEQNVHDAIEILPKLRTGLDVNIRFTGITDFEYTPECIIFDLLRIPLYHGWLCDPSLVELQNAIGNQSYNQIVDYIITNKNSTDPTIQAKVSMAEEFLEGTASQLTCYGLNELKSKIRDNEIGILFRNNHFLTMLKRQNEIYTLVTDHGYLTEDNIIWETLDNIEGAGRFFDAYFQISNTTTTKQAIDFEAEKKRQQQLEMDYLLALSLREDEPTPPEQTIDSDSENKQLVPMSSPAEALDSQTSPEYGKLEDLERRASELILENDYQLAKKLQAEEDRLQERHDQSRVGQEAQSLDRRQREEVNQSHKGQSHAAPVDVQSETSHQTSASESRYSQVVSRTSSVDQSHFSNPQYHSQQQQEQHQNPEARPVVPPSGSPSNASNRRQKNGKSSKDPNCSVL